LPIDTLTTAGRSIFVLDSRRKPSKHSKRFFIVEKTQKTFAF